MATSHLPRKEKSCVSASSPLEGCILTLGLRKRAGTHQNTAVWLCVAGSLSRSALWNAPVLVSRVPYLTFRNLPLSGLSDVSTRMLFVFHIFFLCVGVFTCAHKGKRCLPLLLSRCFGVFPPDRFSD